MRARFDETDPVPGAYLGEFLEGVGWGMSLSSQEGPMPLVRAMDAWDISRPNWEKSLRKGFGRGLGARMQIEAEFGEPEDVIYDEGLGAQLRRNAEIYGVGFDVAAESILMWDNPRRTALVRGFSSEGREVFSE
ncbi:MAG: hypothetical protein M5R36_14440 [Deltaproteobacteria bacterium]|nr:hypothetical protein [Deltaproteobacteria bacterium]